MRNVKVNGIVVIDGKSNSYDIKFDVPDCPLKYLAGNIKTRYLKEKVVEFMGKPIDYIRSFSIEEIKNNDKQASFYNKSIFEMNKKELRDLCCEFCFLNINTEGLTLNKLQETIAVEYLKRLYKKDIKHTEYYITDKQGKSYIDFDGLRDDKVNKLFIIKSEHKSIIIRDKEQNNNDKKLDRLSDLLPNDKEENIETIIKQNSKNKKDNFEDDLKELEK